MEHSLLHAVQMLGLICALGGVLFFLLVLRPASRVGEGELAMAEVREGIGRWVALAAFVAAVAGVLNLFVQVAELEGKSVYSGVRFSELWRYLGETTVGNLTAARIGFLLGMAGVMASVLPGKWYLCALLGGTAAVCAGLVSHAAALPTGRAPALVAQIIHISAAAMWLGMLMHFCLCMGILSRSARDGAVVLRKEVFRRFSPFALFGVMLLGGSGLYGAYRFVQAPSAMVNSAYGLTLLLKLSLLTVALFAGYQNWRVVRPSVLSAENDSSVAIGQFGRWGELELTAGILVVVLAAILGSISPPGVDGSARLNAAQIAAVVSPNLPPIRFVDPSSFVGAESRNEQDLRYSEFTHRWSGIMVMLLGMFWLGQSSGGQTLRKICAWAWPLLLVPFGLFVAVFADPEPWLMGKMTLAEILRSPDILEHQLAAGLVFVLVLFGILDRRKTAHGRPLGYLLPVIMILGSLMLLGHAHSNLRMSEELSSLINAQHAMMGGCGLLAGFVRWLQLRGIFSGKWARVAWPAGVVALGIAMAFFYTEFI
jgi:putative copper export protein